jgi:gliding motility-associated-like protein
MLHLIRIAIICFLLMPATMFAQLKRGFVENRGQWPAQVVASSKFGNHSFYLERTGFTYHMRDVKGIQQAHNKGLTPQPNDVRVKGHVYHVNFEGAQQTGRVEKKKASVTLYNYIFGNDPSRWASNCVAYEEVTLHSIYDGIDITTYIQDGMLKYDFIVSPHADPKQIALQFEGVDKLHLQHGRIEVHLSTGVVYEQSPIAWQIIQGEKRFIACEYQLEEGRVKYHFPKGYDTKYPLIIDPQVVFSTYSGSESDNFGYSATYDEQGNLYSGSSAFGQGYPTTTGAYQETHAGGDSAIESGIDMALSKYSADGTTMIWSTFVGGSGDDLPHSLIVNSADELYVYGCTGSDDFPLTTNAYQNQFLGGANISPTGTGATFPNGTDIALVHLNASGSALIGSTYVGGDANDGINAAILLKRNYADEFRGEISLDNQEFPIIISSTFSTDFPTFNAFQNTNNGGQEAVVFRLNPQLSSMSWSSYLGGSNDDSGFSLTAHPNGNYYLTGGTASNNFPVTANAYQTNFSGVVDGYVAQISGNGQSIVSATYYGANNYDQIYFVETDQAGAIYGYGQSISPGNALISNVGYSVSNSGNTLMKFNDALTSLVWSTVIGTGDGNPNLSPSAFLVDYCNRIYISGWGVSTIGSLLNPGSHLFPLTDLETTSDAQFPTSSTGGFYMAVFDDAMTTLEYATFYGGNTSSEHVDGGTSRFDRKGIIYQSVCAGCGSNDDFPIFPSDAWSATNNSTNCNNGVFKFDFQLPLTIADFTFESGCVNTPITFTSNSTFAQTYEWNFGNLGTSNAINPTFVFTSPGFYDITLIVQHPNTCNLSDTLVQTIEIFAANGTQLPLAIVCEDETFILGSPDSPVDADYTWTPDLYLDDSTLPQPLFTAGESTTYMALIDHGACVDTLFQNIDVPQLTLSLPNDTVLCDAATLTFNALYTPVDGTIAWSTSPSFTNLINDDGNDSDIEVNVSSPTTFYARVRVGDCEIVDSVVVQTVNFQTIIEGDFAVCEGDNTTLHILNPNPEFIYTWSPADLILSGQLTPSVVVTVPETTTYSVVSSFQNCEAHDEVTVTISDLNEMSASASATPHVIVNGQSTQLQAEPDGHTYNWSPVEDLNNSTLQSPLAQPETTTTYYVQINDGECSVMDSVTIRVVEFVCGPPSIYVPNAFTPNRDGVNEKLFVRANNIDQLFFVIYDRWGEKMFETQSLSLGWDGRYKGEPLPPDVYTYYLEVTCEGGTTYFDKGNITLIR